MHVFFSFLSFFLLTKDLELVTLTRAGKRQGSRTCDARRRPTGRQQLQLCGRVQATGAIRQRIQRPTPAEEWKTCGHLVPAVCTNLFSTTAQGAYMPWNYGWVLYLYDDSWNRFWSSSIHLTRFE